MILTGAREYLLGRQWPRSLLERQQNGLTLNRLTCHNTSISENSHIRKLFSLNTFLLEPLES